MKYSPLSMSRRHVLGDLYSRCDHLDSIPVFLNGSEPEEIGHVDECLGLYADAFCFHLSDDNCRKLSTGRFTFSFEFELAEHGNDDGTGRRITLKTISLVPLKAYERPGSKKANADSRPDH